jgi:hypothetical protein
MKVIVEFHVGRDGIASEWSLHLPRESESIKLFQNPLTVGVRKDEELRRATRHLGEKGSPQEGHVLEDFSAVVDEFARVWPSVLRTIAKISGDSVQLTYFSGLAEEGNLFSLWPHLPFDYRDKRRFFVGEMRKDNPGEGAVPTWVCVEYSHESFKRLADQGAFSYAPGMTVMGLSVAEARVVSHLTKDVFDKNILEKSLRDQGLRCWWFCDSDFEGMTIWHKDYPGDELAKMLQQGIIA